MKVVKKGAIPVWGPEEKECFYCKSILLVEEYDLKRAKARLAIDDDGFGVSETYDVIKVPRKRWKCPVCRAWNYLDWE